MSKQTAVEWLNQQLIDRQNGIGDSRSWDEIVEQAKAMEKEQIEEAWKRGNLPTSLGRVLTEKDYYKETYGGYK